MNKTEERPAALSMRDIRGDLVTVKEVADYMHISKGTVYNLIKDGELSAVKARGNMIRLNREQVCDYFGL